MPVLSPVLAPVPVTVPQSPQSVSVPVTEVAALQLKQFNSIFEELVYWFGRLIQVVYLKWSNSGERVNKVASVFAETLKNQILLSCSAPETHQSDELAFMGAYDLSFLNKDQLLALKDQLAPFHDDKSNQRLLQTVRASVELAGVRTTKETLQLVVAAFEAKLRALPPQPMRSEPVTNCHPPSLSSPDVEAEPLPPVPHQPLEVAPPVPSPARRTTRGAFGPAAAAAQQLGLYDDITLDFAKMLHSPETRHKEKVNAVGSFNSKLTVADLKSIDSMLPSFGVVKELAHVLDSYSAEELAKLIGRVPLASKLYLYEVATQNKGVYEEHIVENYMTLRGTDREGDRAEDRQKQFIAYLVYHSKGSGVNGLYDKLLEEISRKVRIVRANPNAAQIVASTTPQTDSPDRATRRRSRGNFC